MSLTDIVGDGGNVSVSKLLWISDQGLSDRLVSGQNHHFIRSKVNSENWSIFISKLWREKWSEPFLVVWVLEGVADHWPHRGFYEASWDQSAAGCRSEGDATVLEAPSSAPGRSWRRDRGPAGKSQSTAERWDRRRGRKPSSETFVLLTMEPRPDHWGELRSTEPDPSVESKTLNLGQFII